MMWLSHFKTNLHNYEVIIINNVHKLINYICNYYKNNTSSDY